MKHSPKALNGKPIPAHYVYTDLNAHGIGMTPPFGVRVSPEERERRESLWKPLFDSLGGHCRRFVDPPTVTD